jgi:hypothetical protein
MYTLLDRNILSLRAPARQCAHMHSRGSSNRLADNAPIQFTLLEVHRTSVLVAILLDATFL